ncbi:glycosyltransferase [Stutzerimonas nitrititolerans]|uniref:glycosyltransferase n=1 Tax=Stutzerimonas nitrititolerans TaxID=2482751 RepID=UPI002899DEC5|nr:glycosyltransferase [Stutzerimonas nitrititolerans]
MATYNGERFLRAQLDSFLRQTQRPDEVVITDDQSTDGTLEIIRDFAERAPFTVKYSVNRERLGYAANFNAALMLADGDIVFISDQDDVWFSEKIEVITNLASNSQGLLFINDAELTNESLKPTNLTKLTQIRTAGLGDDSFVMGCCCAVRRELLDICLPIPKGVSAHDSWLVYFSQIFSARVIVEKVLQFYRRHEHNESQFIANRTTRVTKFDMVAHRVRRLPELINSKQPLKDQEQLELIVLGTRNALSRKLGDEKSFQLSLALRKSTEKLAQLELRKRVRSYGLPRRVAYVLWFIIRRRYKGGARVKDIILDLAG